MFDTPELFFDLWNIIDEPQKFFFMKTVINDGNTLLIKNNINPNIDIFYLYGKDADYAKIENEAHKQTQIISYYSKNADRMQMRNIPCGYGVYHINTSVIFENSGCAEFEALPDCYYEKATAEDISVLPCADAETEHDYISQIKDALNSKSQEVRTLKENGKSVCFLILTDAVSVRFDRKCKYVSAVYTLSEYRNKGYAQSLLKSVIKKNGNDKFLYVADSDKNIASLKLARKCGFDIIGYNHQIKTDRRKI